MELDDYNMNKVVIPTGKTMVFDGGAIKQEGGDVTSKYKKDVKNKM